MTTKLELNDQDAQDFILFQKNYTNFRRLLDAGVFDMKCGKIILDFDSGSEIQNIQKIMNYHFTIKLSTTHSKEQGS